MDEYEVRRWTGWYRHITLALLVHAFLAVTRFYAHRRRCKRFRECLIGGHELIHRDGARGETAVMPTAVATPPE